MINTDKLKENEVFKYIKSNIKVSFGILIFLFFNLLTIQLAFRGSSFIMILILSIISLLSYFVFKKETTGSDNEFCLKAFKIFILMIPILFVNDTFLSFLNNLNSEKVKSLSFLIIMFDFIISIAYIVLMREESVQNIILSIHNSTFKTIGNKNEEEEIKPGDAVLGYAIDENGQKTNKPVILPLKDRFLHMLILGPTGCGKTSQSVIPMINRDMSNPAMGVTVLEPKGDLAEKIFAMAKHYNREVLYFNPTLPDCPYFNPLYGKENDVVENLATTFNMLNPDSPQFFKDMSEGLIRRCVKLLKRLYDNDATLLHLNTLVWNTEGQGMEMVEQFAMKNFYDPDVVKENEDIISWIKNDYYSGLSGERGATKTFEHCSGVRSQISKLVSNQYLRKVLNPPPGRGSDLDFDDAFERGIIVTIGTAQGDLRDLGRYLGYFIILQLQSAVFRRPGNENTRKHNMLYIDEFQVYSNPGFADMLTMGRSYRVASHLATQARAQIGMGGGSDGKAFVELVSTNARNKIIYPGVSSADAKYYSEEFGEVLKVTESKSYSQSQYFSNMKDKKVTKQVKESMESRFSINDIIYREFGEITYCIIKNNSIQAPGVSKIEYIPRELNEKLDNMVAEYNAEQKEKALLLQQQKSNPNKNFNLSKEPIKEAINDEIEINENGFLDDLDIPSKKFNLNDDTDDLGIEEDIIDNFNNINNINNNINNNDKIDDILDEALDLEDDII